MPPSGALTSASRCWAGSATPGSTRPTCTTGARCHCEPCSARRPSGRGTWPGWPWPGAADGWVVPHLPRPWGRGAGALEQVVIHQEMKEAGLRAPVLAIGAWVVPALIQYGTAEQQQRFLPPTLRGDFLWCQLFSEPGAGSDLAGLTTRAVRVEGDSEGGMGRRAGGGRL